MSRSSTHAQILALSHDIHALCHGKGAIALAALLVETGSGLEGAFESMNSEPPEIMVVLAEVIRCALEQMLPEMDAAPSSRPTAH